MTIRQQNSEPIEHGELRGCRLRISGSNKIVFGSYCIWTAGDSDTWEFAADSIDDLIDLLKELRKIDESDCA